MRIELSLKSDNIDRVMKKQKQAMSPSKLIILSIFWYVLVSCIAISTNFHNKIADLLADPNATSTRMESVLAIGIMVISFLPTGIILADFYIRKNRSRGTKYTIISIGLGISLALYVLFSWCDFALNYAS